MVANFLDALCLMGPAE